jgi:arsenite methyltransferase
MGPRERLLAGLARQLGHPSGPVGRLVGIGLRRGNAAVVSGAVAATAVGPGQTVADIGFGGGLGLTLFLDRVGPTGRVYGVEVSDDMLAVARRRLRAEIADGRLTLEHASMDRLPLPDAALHGIVTTNTVYFIADLAQAFGELRRVLAPGGRLSVGAGDPDTMATIPFTDYGFRLRPIDELVAVAAASGLKLRDRRTVQNGRLPVHILVFG